MDAGFILFALGAFCFGGALTDDTSISTGDVVMRILGVLAGASAMVAAVVLLVTGQLA